METKIIVLAINDWTFEDKNGTSIYYLPSVSKNDARQRGFFPVKKSLNDQLAQIIRQSPLPAVFNMAFDFGSSVGGKMDISITGFKFIKEVSFGS